MGELFWKTKRLEFKVLNKSKDKNDKINFNVRLVPFWYEGFGLMFKTKKNAKPLLFNFRKSIKLSIFSYFIPFDFLAIWIDSNNYVVETKIVNPNTRSVIPSDSFTKLIEIPISKKYSKSVNFFKNNKKKIILSSIKTVF